MAEQDGSAQRPGVRLPGPRASGRAEPRPRRAGGTRLQSVQRALAILAEVARHPKGLTAKRLARFLDVPLATTYHVLRTLTYDGWLERIDGQYRVGPAALAFCGTAMGSDVDGGGGGEGTQRAADPGDQQGFCRV